MDIKILEILLQVPILIFYIIIFLIPYIFYKNLNYNTLNSFIKITFTFSSSLIISFLITIFIAYYSNELYKNIILDFYGYNFEGMSDYEYYQNVNKENLTDLKRIRESQMGIGWPLKAFFTFVVISLPVNLVSNIIFYLKFSKNL